MQKKSAEDERNARKWKPDHVRPNITTTTHKRTKKTLPSMAVMGGEKDTGDFKDKQFAESEVADKVVEQCKLETGC